MKINFFIPLEMDQFYPETAKNALRILWRLGCTVNYPLSQTDCGKMAFESGYWEEAKKIAEKFIKEFSSSMPIICPSTSVTLFIQNNYEKIFYNSVYHIEYQRITKSISEFCDFIYGEMKAWDIGAVFEHPVFLHDCHIGRTNTVTMQLLSRVRGLRVVNQHNDNTSCGSEMLMKSENEPIAISMTARKVKTALDLGAEYIVVSDISCQMQLETYIKQQNLPLTVINIIDILVTGC